MHCNVALLIYVSKSLILQEASAGISNENLRINFQGITVVVKVLVFLHGLQLEVQTRAAEVLLNFVVRFCLSCEGTARYFLP